MVRSFTSESVSRELLTEILDLARHAPSAGYSQGSSFLVLDNPEKVEQFWEISFAGVDRNEFVWQGLLKAPVIILPIAESETYIQRYGSADKAKAQHNDPKKWQTPYWLVDTAFVVQNLLLAVHAQGLGALFFGVFDNEAEIKSAFQIPPSHQLLGAVAIGNVDQQNQRDSNSLARGRRSVDEVIHFNIW